MTFVWHSFLHTKAFGLFLIIFGKNFIFVIHSDTFSLIFVSLLLNTQVHICHTFSFTFVWHSIRYSFSHSLKTALLLITFRKNFIFVTHSVWYLIPLCHTHKCYYTFSLTFVWHWIRHSIIHSQALGLFSIIFSKSFTFVIIFENNFIIVIHSD